LLGVRHDHPSHDNLFKQQPSAAVVVAHSGRRKWMFRLLAMVVIPLVGLCLLETCLRLVHYGFPTSFLVPLQINGKAMLVENAKFGWRFFPPALARSPTPVAIAAVKPAGVFRIFLFGESAALGDPRPAFGVGRYLETLLRDRYPGTEFEVVCVAMTAINSHAIVPIAQECARYQGDLWIVYMGNNEYIGPFGPNTVFGPSALPVPAIRAYLALLKTRSGQLCVALTRRLNGGGIPKAGWSGLKMFQQNQIPPGEPRREHLNASFRGNLEAIVDAGLRSGIPILLSSMASNLKDCAPFGSLHAPMPSDPALAEWERSFSAGSTNAQQGRWNEALRSYDEAARISPKFAELQFRLGESWLAISNNSSAAKSFTLARDLDALPFRADSKLNQAVEECARRHAGEGVTYLDAETALAQASPDGITGHELFLEHVHLNFDGNYRLALAVAEQIKSRLPSAIKNRETSAWAASDACARELGLSDWNRYYVLDEISRRLLDAPYVNQYDHLRQRRRILDQIAEVRQRLLPQNYPAARSAYDEAIRKRPQDNWLHQNYAEFLEATGDLVQATAEWQMVQDLLPHHHAAYFQTGRLFARQRKNDEARASLEAALRIRPDLAEAYLEIGQTYANERKWEHALGQYDLAQKYRPDDARVHLRRADVLAAQNKRSEAIQSIREAIRLRPSYWEARYLLGVELAVDDKISEAQTEFTEVVRLRPDHVLARLNLGVALARQKRFTEALTQFQETLRLDPDNQSARQYVDTITKLQQGSGLP
jgi:tetratricopeptide (TPR) repeat protein